MMDRPPRGLDGAGIVAAALRLWMRSDTAVWRWLRRRSRALSP